MNSTDWFIMKAAASNCIDAAALMKEGRIDEAITLMTKTAEALDLYANREREIKLAYNRRK